MSDFVADLERELVAAARRRATRRRVVLVPRLRPATVLAVVAVVAMLVVAAAVVRGLEDGSRPGDERPQVPPPSGPAFALPAAPVAEPCPGVEQREEDDVIQHPLSIFARPRTAADAVPALAGADSFAWIRAGTIHVSARAARPPIGSTPRCTWCRPPSPGGAARATATGRRCSRSASSPSARRPSCGASRSSRSRAAARWR